jgi:Mg-chelatase subunit ChlD
MFASCFKADAARAPNPRARRGFVLVTAAGIVLLVLLPAIGLAIDVGMMYLVQLRLSAASDAAALAGARALSRGSDDAAQRANAEATANTYFHANFPAGYFASTNVQVSSVAATDSAYMRSVTTTSRVDLPFLFLRALRLDQTTLRATVKSTRRDVNIMIVMDRSGSLQTSGACAPLKAAAVNFVEKFAEGRDNVGLVTFATGSRVDVHLTSTFKTTVETTVNNLVCTGATNSAQGLWQSYQELAGLAQTGALNVIVFFTDGRPTAVTETFPIKTTSPCTPLHSATPKLGVITLGSVTQGLYRWAAPVQPLPSDVTVITDHAGCKFFTSGVTSVTTDVPYAPLTDYWGNSLNPANAYRSVTLSAPGLSITSATNVENFSTNAADHAGLRIRRGDPDAMNANRTLAGVTIFSIGLGDVDEVLLKRIANDRSLTPNPVAAGNLGLYVYAANATELDLAFTRVASEMLRLAR